MYLSIVYIIQGICTCVRFVGLCVSKYCLQHTEDVYLCQVCRSLALGATTLGCLTYKPHTSLYALSNKVTGKT